VVGGVSTDPDVACALIDALAPGSSIGVAVHDEDLRLLLISPSLAAWAGLPAEEQLGRRLADTLPGEAGAIAEATLRQVAATGEPLIAAEPADPGRERGWLISVYPLPFQDRRLLAVIAFDVTESRRARERLRHSRELLATAQRMAHVGSWRWDVEEDKWTWSDELFRLTGLPEGEPPRLKVLLAAVPGDDRAALLQVTGDLLRRGAPAELAFPIERPDGTRRIIRGRGVPRRGDNGRVVRVDGFAQDVTELARAEAQQAAVAALGRLALSGMPIDALLRRAADTVAEELELEFAGVAEALPNGAGHVLRAVSRGTDPLLDGHEVVTRPDSLLAYTLRLGAPMVIPDWETESRLERSATLARYGVRSSAAVPIGPPDAPIGVLSGHSREAHRVSDDDVTFMATVANMIASATERLHVEEKVASHSAARGRLVAHALDAEDRTRRMISEALHDGPLQDLLALGHDIARLQPAAEGDEIHLERVRSGLARAVSLVRESMLDLHPVMLQVGGLESALRAICAHHSGFDGYECDVEIDARAAGVRDELVLSLARELLRNVGKHAGASHVRVRVARVDEGIVLDVTDDGVGMPAGRFSEALGQGHIGLASGRERAEAIGGRLRVGPRGDGRPGTQAVALLPGA
jgi:signal transduction histidine kinase/PAS domain-containing protein